MLGTVMMGKFEKGTQSVSCYEGKSCSVSYVMYNIVAYNGTRQRCKPSTGSNAVGMIRLLLLVEYFGCKL